MVLPALVLARSEHAVGRLDRDEFHRITSMIRSAIQLLETKGDGKREGVRPRVVAKALNGDADLVAIEMMNQSVFSEGELEITPESKLTGETIDNLSSQPNSIFCISAMPPGAELAASVLCRRIRLHLPEQKILVCRWGMEGSSADSRVLLDAGADWVVGSIAAASKLILELSTSSERGKV
jgi:hypothetical protein